MSEFPAAIDGSSAIGKSAGGAANGSPPEFTGSKEFGSFSPNGSLAANDDSGSGTVLSSGIVASGSVGEMSDGNRSAARFVVG